MVVTFPPIKPPICYIRAYEKPQFEKPQLNSINNCYLQQQKLKNNQYLSGSHKVTLWYEDCLFFDFNSSKNKSWKISQTHAQGPKEKNFKNSLSPGDSNKNKELWFNINSYIQTHSQASPKHNSKDQEENSKNFDIELWTKFEGSKLSIEDQKEQEESSRSILSGIVKLITKVNLPTDKTMAELELLKLEIVTTRGKIFESEISCLKKRIKKLKSKSLQNKIFELHRRDIENQSLESSTSALPSLMKETVKVLLSGEITPEIAQEHLSFCTLIAIPYPTVPLRNDINRIKTHLRYRLVDKLSQIEEKCEREIQYKEKTDGFNDDGTITLSYTARNLYHTSETTGLVFEELESPVNTGVLHCQLPKWQQELDAGITRTGKRVASKMIRDRWEDRARRKNRRNKKIKLRLNIKKSAQTDMDEVD